MAEKEKQGGVSPSFYSQAAILVSIACSAVIGFTYLGTLIENKIDDKIAPIVEKINNLEDKAKEHDNLLAVNTDRVSATITSLNAFVDYYNRVYHKEFLRPSDITSRNIEPEQPKKRR